MKSKFGKLNKRDFWKGLILVIITAVFSSVIIVFQNGTDLKTLNWYPVWSSAIIAFCSYIVKNIFTNENDQFLKTEKNTGNEQS